MSNVAVSRMLFLFFLQRPTPLLDLGNGSKDLQGLRLTTKWVKVGSIDKLGIDPGFSFKPKVWRAALPAIPATLLPYSTDFERARHKGAPATDVVFPQCLGIYACSSALVGLLDVRAVSGGIPAGRHENGWVHLFFLKRESETRLLGTSSEAWCKAVDSFALVRLRKASFDATFPGNPLTGKQRGIP